MNSYETAIAERLQNAADRIPVDTNAGSIELGHMTVLGRSSTRRRGLMVGLAVAASAAALVVAVSFTPNKDILIAGSADTHVPVGEESTASSRSFAAHVASPPDWFGEPRAGYRAGGLRDGRWVSMAIGKVSDDAITEPIVISVFDGTYEPLDGAQTVMIDGASRRSIRFEGWQALATDETPTVLVTGSTDEHTLNAVLDAVEVIDPLGTFSVRLRVRPDGYAEVVDRRVLGPDPEMSRTLAGESGDVGINEVADWTDPLLYAASSGADLMAVDLGADTGWIGVSTANPSGPLRFLVWSPRPGAIFEITTDDIDRTNRDLIDLALATSALEIRDWDSLYRD